MNTHNFVNKMSGLMLGFGSYKMFHKLWSDSKPSLSEFILLKNNLIMWYSKVTIVSTRTIAFWKYLYQFSEIKFDRPVVDTIRKRTQSGGKPLGQSSANFATVFIARVCVLYFLTLAKARAMQWRERSSGGRFSVRTSNLSCDFAKRSVRSDTVQMYFRVLFKIGFSIIK